MRAIDARSAALGVSTRTLMENAGHAVAREISHRLLSRPTAVLCGPGNNGGDGWVAARYLRDLGWDVWVESLVDPAALKGDAADAAKSFGGKIYRIGESAPAADLYVDALFGAGLSRGLEGEAARLAEILSAAPERVVAVDVPSGLRGDGETPFGAHFHAALTVTFVRKKPVHLLAPMRAACGEIVVADIGTLSRALDEQNVRLFENTPALWQNTFPWPSLDAHKHARGHCMVMSGPMTRTGAARLAARAALRAGAGLSTVLSPADALLVNASQLTSVMVQRADSAEDTAKAAEHAASVVIGPAAGVTQTTRDAVMSLLAQDAALVLDADALTVFNDAPDGLFASLRARDVLTPHVGEFKRVFPGLLEQGPTRIHAAREAARKSGAVVLLKGPDTVIAAPDGRACVCAIDAPFLATAGSGDTLAGLIGGLLAQGMASFEAAAAGAWLHARAGEKLGPGLIAEDLEAELPSVLNEMAPTHLRRR